MAQEVHAYIGTGLNDKNRLLNGLIPLEKKSDTIMVGKEIIVGKPFYCQIPNSIPLNKINEIDYIRFTNTATGIEYGAFVDSIEQMALSSTYKVSYHIDWWGTIRNQNMNNLTLHGKVIHGHVNDWAEDDLYAGVYKPTLENTYNTPEFDITKSEYYYYENIVGGSPLLFYDYDNNAYPYLFVYIYINEPLKLKARWYDSEGAVIVDDILKFKATTKDNVFDLTGALFVGVLNLESGNVVFQGSYTADIIPSPIFGGKRIVPLNNIKNSFITSMCVSNIPPCKDVNGNVPLTLDDGLVRLDISEDDRGGYAVSQTEDIDIPLMKKEVEFGASVIPKVYNISESYRVESLFRRYYSNTSYSNSSFENNIVKVNSSVYNPCFLNNTFIDTLKIPQERRFTVALREDLSSYELTYNTNNSSGLFNYSNINNYCVFLPDTTNSYWDRLNASRTMASAKESKKQAIFSIVGNAVSLPLNVGKKAVNSFTSVRYGLSYTSDDTPEPTNFKSGSVIDNIAKISKASTDMKIADKTYEIARSEYDIGTVSTTPTTGYYNMFYELGVRYTHITLSDNAKEKIAYLLNMYGYNTFLQIDDILENHLRKKWNYIQTQDCHCEKLNSEISQDIEGMFDGGVWLWNNSDDIGNFNQVNEQANINLQEV